MSLNKFTDLQIGKDLGLKIGASDIEATNIEVQTLTVENIIPANIGGSIETDNLKVNGNAIVVANDLTEINYKTPDQGQPNYVLTTDGVGSVFFAPPDTGSSDITYNGTPPVVIGQHLKFSSTNASTANESDLIEDGIELRLQRDNAVLKLQSQTDALDSGASLSFARNDGLQVSSISQDGADGLTIQNQKDGGVMTIKNEFGFDKNLNLTGNDILNCGTLNYTSLNPPIGSGFIPNRFLRSSNTGVIEVSDTLRITESKGDEQVVLVETVLPRLTLKSTTTNPSIIAIENTIGGSFTTNRISSDITSLTEGYMIFNIVNTPILSLSQDGTTITGDTVCSTGLFLHNGTTFTVSSIGEVKIENAGTALINPSSTLTIKGFNATGDISMGSNSITSLSDPVNPQDASTKSYVDTTISPLQTKTQNISLTTSPSETVFDNDIKIGGLPLSAVSAYTPDVVGTGIRTTAGNNGFRFEPTKNMTITLLKYKVDIFDAGSSRTMTVWRDSDGANLGQHVFNGTEPVVGGYYTDVVSIPLVAGTVYVISVNKAPASANLSLDSATNKIPSTDIINIVGRTNNDLTPTRPNTDQTSGTVYIPQFEYIADASFSDLYCKDIYLGGGVISSNLIKTTSTTLTVDEMKSKQIIIRPSINPTIITLPAKSTLSSDVYNMRIVRDMSVNPTFLVQVALSAPDWWEEQAGFRTLVMGNFNKIHEISASDQIYTHSNKMVASMGRVLNVPWDASNFVAQSPMPFGGDTTLFSEIFSFTNSTTLTCNVSNVYQVSFVASIDSSIPSAYTVNAVLSVNGTPFSPTSVSSGNGSGEDTSISFNYVGLQINAGDTIQLLMTNTGLNGNVSQATMIMTTIL